MSLDFRFAENTDLYAGFFKHLFEVAHLDFVGVTFNYDCTRGRRAVETYIAYRQTEQRTGMQSEFAQILRYHRHHTGVVRTGRHFREDYFVTLDEKFHAEYTVAA